MANNIFNTVEMARVDSNVFDLSHDIKLSFNMGQLVPICVMETLPGDRFKISPENLLRFAPLVSPVMHRVRVTTHFFFVPNRILWPNWDEWITGQLEVEHPFINFNELTTGSLGDYLGYPTGEFSNATVQASPFPIVAYNKIYNEYYRDQNLQLEVQDELIDGNNTAFLLTSFEGAPRNRAWMHDYFTSCLPFAQKGDIVQIPLTQSDTVPVDWVAKNSSFTPFPRMRVIDTGVDPALGGVEQFGVPGGLRIGSSGGVTVSYDPAGTLAVDVQSDAVDINTLRRAFRLQEWLEKNARGGTRYTEHLKAHWGVNSSDARLQRPEYIGGLKQNMVISEVLSTASNVTDSSYVGSMAGHGLSVGGGNTFTHYCEEHGWIIGIMSVTPDTSYQQGLHRSLSRFDPLDYAWPTFANIGEQEVLIKELLIGQLTDTALNITFGYIPRYSEYRYMNSRVAGDFKDTLAFWHLGRIFNESIPPLLNDDFIKCVPRNDIFAVTDGTDTIYAHVINQVSCIRKLPKFGVPTI